MSDFCVQAQTATSEIVKLGKLQKGQILVVGCSTSEITGNKIGTQSVPEVAESVVSAILEVLNEKGIYLAAQCCEHLNRAIVIERELAERLGLDVVNVVPQPKAGGSFATACYKQFKDPVAVECIRADAGLDIGQTLIGMHLKPVAVPVRLSVKSIGDAIVTAARTRAKFVGGSRAVYNEDLM